MRLDGFILCSILINLLQSRVTSETATGSVDSKRIRLNLTVIVTRTHFSANASTQSTVPDNSQSAPSQGAALEVTGRVASENTFVKMGAHHTLDLEVNREVRIIKDEWDSVSLDRVTESCVEGRGADIGAIVCGEGILAHSDMSLS